tara:strand:- start:279 stop:1205 length:927 start_codon:yes stop_codon:yes gene_type:complete
MLRYVWYVIGSGCKRPAPASTKAPRSKLITRYDPDEDDDTATASSSSISSMYNESSEDCASAPPSPTIPPSPTLSPPRLRTIWPPVENGLEGAASLDGLETDEAEEAMLQCYECVECDESESESEEVAAPDGFMAELEAQDRELYLALVEFLESFRGSSLRLCLRIRVTSAAADAPLDLVIDVGPEGADASRYDATFQWPVAPCTISCDRAALLGIIRGTSSPMNALMTGAVMVDDLGQLMAFSTCFDCEAIACARVRTSNRLSRGPSAADAQPADAELDKSRPNDEQLQPYQQGTWAAELEPGLLLV